MQDETDYNPFVSDVQVSALDRDVIRAYSETGRTVDSLAYSDEFESLYKQITQAGHRVSKQEVFRRLLILRKSGLLPRFFRTGEPAA